MTDDEKHDHCLKLLGMHAVFLPLALYDRAEQQGFDMRCYVKQQPIPTIERLPIWVDPALPKAVQDDLRRHFDGEVKAAGHRIGKTDLNLQQIADELGIDLPEPD